MIPNFEEQPQHYFPPFLPPANGSVRTKQIFYRNTENRKWPFQKTEIRPKQNILPKQSYFCRNNTISAETNLSLPKENNFGRTKLICAQEILFLSNP